MTASPDTVLSEGTIMSVMYMPSCWLGVFFTYLGHWPVAGLVCTR
jgi:hypothetical protein